MKQTKTYMIYLDRDCSVSIVIKSNGQFEHRNKFGKGVYNMGQRLGQISAFTKVVGV